MRRLTHEEALVEADRQDAERGSVAMRAGSFTKDMVARLERQVAFAPQLPPDAHVALAMDPNGEALMEQFVAEYSRQQPVQLTATQRRQIEAVSRRATDYLGGGAPIEQSLNEQMGTRFGERNVVGEIGGFINRQVRRVPGASPVLDAGANVARDTVRGLSPVLQFPEQAAAGVGRNVAGAVTGTNSDEWDNYWRDPINNERPNASVAGQTDLGVITDEFQSALFERRRPEVDQGTGWFTGEESGVFTERQRRERTMGTLPNGQTYTLGRLAAWAPVSAGIIEPDGDAYNVISGFVDAGVALSVPGPELALAQGARRTRSLATELGGGVSGLSHRTGAVQGLYTQYDRTRWAGYLSSRRAQPVVDMMTDASGDRGWLEIWQATDGSLSPATVSMLVDAKSGDEVRDIMMLATEVGQRPTVRTGFGQRLDAIGRGAADRTPSARRLWGRAPTMGPDAADPMDFVSSVDDVTRVLKMDSDEMSSWVARAGRAADEGERYNIWEGLWAESAARMSADHGVNQARARQIAQFMRSEVDTTRAAIDDMIQFGVDDWSKAISPVDGQPLPGAFLLAERARHLPMPNVRELRRATSRMRPFFELSDAAAEGGFVTRVVKGADGKPLLNADGTEVVRRVSATQAVERLTNLFGTGWEASTGALLWGQSNIWKPARLLRFGYTLRVTPEEFGRRVWDGQTWVTHPGGVFALFGDSRNVDELTEALTGRSGLGRIVDDVVQVGDNGPEFTVVAGFDDDMMKRALVQTETLNGMLDPYTPLREMVRGSAAPSAGRGPLTRIQAFANDGTLNTGFTAGWRDRLMTVGSDPVAQRVARDGVDETWRWLMRLGEEGTPVLDEAAEFGPLTSRMLDDESLQAADQRFWERLQAMHVERDGQTILADPEGLRQYLQSTQNQIEALTGGDDALLRVVRSGRWDDRISLADKANEGLSPQAVAVPSVAGNSATRGFRNMINGFFEMTVTLPANKLNRVPAFRTFYERAVVELAPLADDADAFVRGVERAGVRASALDTARRGATGEGLLSIDQIDLLARKHAADQVQELLFDATQRSNFFDQFQLMAPFGEAWREVVTTWARLVKDQPFVPMRYAGMVAREGSRGDAGQTYANIMGVDKEADGFFYEDQYGETSFLYPMSGLAFLGAGLPGGGFEGAVSSLNIAGEVAPGVGPVGAIPASYAIPNTKDWDWLRNMVFPFGEPGDVTEAAPWLPNWFARGWDTLIGDELGYTSSDGENRIANAQLTAMRALASTGDYDLTTTEGFNRLRDDAAKSATTLGLFQAVMYAAGPTAPKTFYEIVGPNGENVEMAVAMNDLYDLYETDPENAIIRWVGEYGMNNILMTQGFTTTTNWGGMPLNQEGWDWYRDNPDVTDDFSEIYGLFAPGPSENEDPDDFVNEAYNFQLESGERTRLTQQQWFAMAQDKVAEAIYRNVRDQYYEAAGGSLNEEQRFLLNNVKADLKERFPRWREASNVGGRVPVPALIDDFERAYSDERLTATPAGQTFRAYWDLRRQVVEAAEANGLVSPDPDAAAGWRQANAGLPYREVLREALGRMTVAEPEFGELASVLEREFKFDD